MARLDSEGIFSIGDRRLELYVLVEVAPPDQTNTERALRLDPPEALREWLVEAAEEAQAPIAHGLAVIRMTRGHRGRLALQ